MFQFMGGPTLPIYNLDCSSTGQGVLTGPSLTLKKLTGEALTVTAKIDVPVSTTTPTSDSV